MNHIDLMNCLALCLHLPCAPSPLHTHVLIIKDASFSAQFHTWEHNDNRSHYLAEVRRRPVRSSNNGQMSPKYYLCSDRGTKCNHGKISSYRWVPPGIWAAISYPGWFQELFTWSLPFIVREKGGDVLILISGLLLGQRPLKMPKALTTRFRMWFSSTGSPPQDSWEGNQG